MKLLTLTFFSSHRRLTRRTALVLGILTLGMSASVRDGMWRIEQDLAGNSPTEYRCLVKPGQTEAPQQAALSLSETRSSPVSTTCQNSTRSGRNRRSSNWFDWIFATHKFPSLHFLDLFELTH